MAPVRDAVCLIDHQKAHPLPKLREDVASERLVGQSFRGHQQDIDPIVVQVIVDHGPFVLVAAVDA
jgi:hypothetical protein